jgi:4-hydroxybenzoyl-CoA reductase subunit beta
MNMGTNDPRYILPESIKSAVEIFSAEENAAFLAGGTDLMPLLQNGLCRPSCLIDLEKFDEFRKIETRGNVLHMGSMADLAGIAEDETINRLLGPVALAARSVASPQIRNMATIGGNLFQERRCIYFNQTEFWRQNVDPCYKLGGNCCYQIPKAKECRALYYSDLAPILMAYEALALFYDGSNRTEMPISDLIHRHCHGNLDKSLMTGILVPHMNDGSSGIFMKYGVRHAIDFAFSNVGIRFTPQKDGGEPASIAIVVGAVAIEPVRLEETENAVLMALNGGEVDKERIYVLAQKELQSRSGLIREFTVSLKGKQNTLLIIVDALRAFFNAMGR